MSKMLKNKILQELEQVPFLITGLAVLSNCFLSGFGELFPKKSPCCEPKPHLLKLKAGSSFENHFFFAVPLY